MADNLLTVEGAAKVRDQIERQVLRAGTEAIKRATKATERGVEEAVRGAVRGDVWKAIASEAYPKRRNIARAPSGIVMIKGKEGSRSRGAVEYFTEPGRIQNSDGFYLAVPLPAAGRRRGDDKMLTPGEWERRTGVRLRFVYRRGKPSLLVADSAVMGAKGTFRRAAAIRTKADERRGFARGAATIPIFVLIPSVPFANTADIRRPIREAGRLIEDEFYRAMREQGEP